MEHGRTVRARGGGDGSGRPFVLGPRWFQITEGSTEVEPGLRMDTLVRSVRALTDQDLALSPPAEHVMHLCEGSPRSVAEVSAGLGIPVHIAKILVTLLLRGGLLEVGATFDRAEDGAALLARLVAGLKKQKDEGSGRAA